MKQQREIYNNREYSILCDSPSLEISLKGAIYAFIVITGSIVTSFIAIIFLLTFLSDDTQRSSFSHKIYLDEESGKMYFPVVNKLMRNLNEIFNVDYTADDLSNGYKQKLLECFFYMNELKIEPTESNRIHYLKSCEPKFQTKP